MRALSQFYFLISSVWFWKTIVLYCLILLYCIFPAWPGRVGRSTSDKNWDMHPEANSQPWQGCVPAISFGQKTEQKVLAQLVLIILKILRLKYLIKYWSSDYSKLTKRICIFVCLFNLLPISLQGNSGQFTIFNWNHKYINKCIKSH